MSELKDILRRELARYEKTKVEPGPDWARSARYLPRTRALRIELRSGAALEIPIRLVQGMLDASPKERATVEVRGGGYSIHWPLIDQDMGVPNLCAGIFGTQAWMRELARRGGSVTSARKAAAARANGKKGGRPRSARQSAATLSHGKEAAGASRNGAPRRTRV